MKRDKREIALRCAVYTRVSTDSILEQDFNSLDNQRDASEAYIKSQAHEGWKLVNKRYDDGGFSGGSSRRLRGNYFRALLSRKVFMPIAVSMVWSRAPWGTGFLRLLSPSALIRRVPQLCN